MEWTDIEEGKLMGFSKGFKMKGCWREKKGPKMTWVSGLCK